MNNHIYYYYYTITYLLLLSLLNFNVIEHFYFIFTVTDIVNYLVFFFKTLCYLFQ